MPVFSAFSGAPRGVPVPVGAIPTRPIDLSGGRIKDNVIGDGDIEALYHSRSTGRRCATIFSAMRTDI